MKTSLLIPEPPLQILPSLAVAIGLNEAIVLQQLFYLLNRPGNGKVLADGEKYIFNTYEQWAEYFPFFSIPTLKRIFYSLEERGLVITIQPDGAMSRRKYYRIGQGALCHLTYESLPDRTNSNDDRIKMIRSGSDQIDTMDVSKCDVPLTETSSETSAERSITPSNGVRHERSEPLISVPTDAETVYEAYPRKIGKQDALKAIAKVLKTKGLPEVLTAVRLFAAETAKWSDDEKRFIPHPATWFNRGSHEDDPQTWKRHGNSENRNGRSFEARNDYSALG